MKKETIDVFSFFFVIFTLLRVMVLSLLQYLLHGFKCTNAISFLLLQQVNKALNKSKRDGYSE